MYDPNAETLDYTIGFECKVIVNARSGAGALALMLGVDREAVYMAGATVQTREGSAEVYLVDGIDREFVVRPKGRPW